MKSFTEVVNRLALSPEWREATEAGKRTMRGIPSYEHSISAAQKAFGHKEADELVAEYGIASIRDAVIRAERTGV